MCACVGVCMSVHVFMCVHVCAYMIVHVCVSAPEWAYMCVRV
jgi:hypothetical protein